MPTYEYKCLKCEKTFEMMLPMGHKETPKCIECGHAKTQKLLSAPQVIFKGSGFYKTDNRVEKLKKKSKQSESKKKDSNTDSAKKNT